MHLHDDEAGRLERREMVRDRGGPEHSEVKHSLRTPKIFTKISMEKGPRFAKKIFF